MDRRRPEVNGLLAVAGLAGVMWVLEIGDAILPGSLDRHGIVPRDPDGLGGIVAAPFLHAGFGHLISNTVPFLAMGAVIALSGLARVLAVTAIVALVSGLGVWLFAGANTVTVGASGVVFGYAGYLIARGFFDRRALHLVVGVIVGLIWGGALLGGLLPEPGISWQAHLFGAVGGVLAARVLRRRTPPAPEGAGGTPAPSY
ncbi:MAG TPA: rhomboid family intramembrane serine protease [Solirubrobacteraceae bacterium]|jgi:membrane associated rhomboid family serine protease